MYRNRRDMTVMSLMQMYFAGVRHAAPVSLLAVAAVLGGCGNKGDLFLVQDKAVEVPAPENDELTETLPSSPVTSPATGPATGPVIGPVIGLPSAVDGLPSSGDLLDEVEDEEDGSKNRTNATGADAVSTQ